LLPLIFTLLLPPLIARHATPRYSLPSMPLILRCC